MTLRSSWIAVSALVALAVASTAAAEPPPLIHYQGYATNALGDPLVGPQTMTLRLCNALVGGTCHWTETKVVSDITDGVFTTNLGDTSVLSLPDLAPAQLYLELEIGAAPNNEVLAPRQRVVSVPYALECSNASTLGSYSLNAVLILAEAEVFAGNALTFPSGFDAISYDVGQGRFEFSDGASFAGPLHVGTSNFTSYSLIGSAGPAPSGLMNASEDLFVTGQLEVYGGLYLDTSELYMRGAAASGQDASQFLYFYNSGLRNAESIKWDDPQDRFELTDELRVLGPLHAGGTDDTTVRPYSAISNSATGLPESGTMDSSADFFVQNQVEFGNQVYLSKNLYMEGSSATSAGGVQSIWFYDSGIRDNEFFRFDPTDEVFQISDPLHAGSNSVPVGTGYHRFSNDATSVAVDASIASGQDVYIEDDLEVGGEIFVTATAADGIGRITTPILRITGGSDLSESFHVGSSDSNSGGSSAIGAAPEPGSVVCIDPARPGTLRVCDAAYDRTVVGVVSGAGDIATGMLMGQQGSIADGDVPVALSGRVYVHADATGAPIAPGDLLTTSAVPGHAMAAVDFARAHGTVIGKAMTPLAGEKGLVLVLVNLQ